MPDKASKSLKASLLEALKLQARGKRAFQLNVLRSQPKRSYTLFPWASDSPVKIYVEYETIILSEKTASADSLQTEKPDGTVTQKAPQFVPVFGLETAIYTIPSTSTSLLYVSKADTTGLLPIPAPSRVLTHAYLKHYLQHPPHNSASLRIHVFARAQDQYLFPGSIDNKVKRVLPDNVLCKWWRQVLGDAAQQSILSTATANPKISMFYLLGGFDYAESLGVLSKAPEPSEPSLPRWTYGHPYSAIPPLLPVQSAQDIKINDLIPAFQDDPKARQLTEWASSPIPYAGQDGDYDEIADEIRKLADASPALHGLRNKEIQEQKDQERKNLTKDSERNVDGFWEVMGNRGECAAGHVAGFFVVVADRTASEAQVSDKITQTESQESKKSDGRSSVHATPASLPQSTYNRLWSQIHNINYASLDKAEEGYEKWRTELQLACKRTGASDPEYEEEVYGMLEVDNPSQIPAESLKRAEPPRQVNTLQVKKKKKVAPPIAQT